MRKKTFIPAMLETENFENMVSSRNLEFAHAVGGEVEILTTNFSHRTKSTTDEIKVANFIGKFINVKLTYFKSYSYKDNISVSRVFFSIFFAVQASYYLYRNAMTGDRVILNSIPPEVLLLCSLAGRLKKCELILDVRDIWPNALDGRGLKRSIFAFYCRVLYVIAFYRKFDRVFYVSPSFVDWIKQNRIISQDIKYIPLGYDKNRWKKISSSKKKVGSKISLIYIGYLSEQFDLMPLITCLNGPRFADKYTLDVVGEGPCLGELISMAGDSIKFHGRFSHLQVVEFINQSSFDFGVVPLSKNSGAFMPNKLFDYLAAELPVISLGSSDCAEFLRDGSFGLSGSNELDSLHNLFDKITRGQIEIFRDNIRACRERFSMQYIYQSAFD